MPLLPCFQRTIAVFDKLRVPLPRRRIVVTIVSIFPGNSRRIRYYECQRGLAACLNLSLGIVKRARAFLTSVRRLRIRPASAVDHRR